jgi:SanA protein
MEALCPQEYTQGADFHRSTALCYSHRVEYLKRKRTWVTLAALAAVLFVTPWLWMRAVYDDRVYTRAEDVPADEAPRVAIVLGAGLARGGGPSPVLYDRVATAADLYHAGRARKLLLSGDNRYVEYNEPEVMRATARSLGVPDGDIVLDYAGRRTYDSCYRARDIFAVGRAVVVTQAFHIDRALYLCDAMGIDAIGVEADRRSYAGERWWALREIPATAAAWLDVNLLHPTPVLGQKMPIDQ